MSPVFVARAYADKRVPEPGDTLSKVLAGAPLKDVGLYNWGTDNHDAINRALVELVGCRAVKPNPMDSVLDPALGTGGVIHIPKPWKADPLALGGAYTFKLKKRLAVPAVAITELTSWFEPQKETCSIKYRLEGAAARADKTVVEVHVARYRDRQGKAQSSYYEVIERKRDQKLSEDRKAASLPDDDNPIERNERQCGTDGPDDTHIWRTPPSTVAPWSSLTATWDGESTAKKGVLQPLSSAKAYINSSCAPYSVLVRYYQSDDDKDAAILFDESFYPRWTVERGGTRTLDPASLTVRWTVKDKHHKLVIGQLLVFDKGGNVVCRVSLNDSMLWAGSLNLDRWWPASQVSRDQMPYRVQIQAHSGPDEAKGLAVAVMPTQVRAYHYKQVQFVAFNVRPPSPYAGDPDHDVDIAARCAAMIQAMQIAEDKRSEKNPEILKIFMAPEFYFRGPEGAYPVEKIESIIPRLREEFDKFQYRDWMFVFGSAIGYHKHGGTTSGSETVHEAPMHDFEISAVGATDVTVKPPSGKSEAVIPLVGWRVINGGKSAVITAVAEVVKWKEYRLSFGAAPGFTTGAAKIRVATLDILQALPPTSANKTQLVVRGASVRAFRRPLSAADTGSPRSDRSGRESPGARRRERRMSSV
jgi:hypothetical protein